MGEINTAHSNTHAEGATFRAQPQACPRTWETLSLPERRELRKTISRCNRPDSPDVELLISSINCEEVRTAALSLLCRKDYLIRNPLSRGRLLEHLIPYAHECRVQAYAMLSLRDELYSRSYSVCAPAAQIIDATKGDRDTAITYELIDLAARRSPQGGDGAAKIAFILLRDSTLSSGQYQLARFHARVWYVEHKGISNPWLDVVTQYKTPTSVKFLRTVVEGNVSDPREYPVLKNILSLPLLPHEIAFTASILTVTAKKLANFFGVMNNLAATTSALTATAIILGGRYMWRAHRLDVVNSKRTYEKLEAINKLQSLLKPPTEGSIHVSDKLKRVIRRILQDQTINFLQEPAVQRAARQALKEA